MWMLEVAELWREKSKSHQSWDLDAKQLHQKKAIRDVMSEVMEKRNEPLFGECLLGIQLFTSQNSFLGGHLFWSRVER